MSDSLPTLLARTNKSQFRLRVHRAAWSLDYGGASELPGLMLLSATGPDTACKAIRAILYQPEVSVEFILEGAEDDQPVRRLGRAALGDWPVMYQAAVAKLAPGAVHLTALAKIPGLMPDLSDDRLWAELSSPRYSTPLLRQWTGWLKRIMVEAGNITMAEGFQATVGVLKTQPAELDALASAGVRAGFLKLEG